MSKAIERGISDALAYAADDSKGYELGSRDYGLGTDCSGLGRRYAAKVEDAPLSSYPDMSTRTMRAVLTARGCWEALPFSISAGERGDLFLKELPGQTGHVVVYLGDMRIVGAEGNWDGVTGDSSGSEICERNYYTYGYNWIIRYTGGDEEEEVTEQDMQRIADLAADAVWAKVLNGVQARDRLIGIDNAANGANNEVHRKDDPTGRGMEMTTHEHVKYIGASQQDIIGKLDDIKAGVDAIGVLASKGE